MSHLLNPFDLCFTWNRDIHNEEKLPQNVIVKHGLKPRFSADLRMFLPQSLDPGFLESGSPPGDSVSMQGVCLLDRLESEFLVVWV